MFTDGGKQNLQRDGFYRLGPMKVTQHMVYQVEINFSFLGNWNQNPFKETDGPMAGVAKGLRTVISERFGTEAVQGGIFFHNLSE